MTRVLPRSRPRFWHVLLLLALVTTSSFLAATPVDAASRPKVECADKRDNDGDGLVDRSDPDCTSNKDTTERPAVVPPPPAACQDGTDNDGDGLTDFGTGPGSDPGCASATDTDEYDVPVPSGPVIGRSYGYDGLYDDPANGLFDKATGQTGDVAYIHFDRVVVVAADATVTLVGADGVQVTRPATAYPHDPKVIYVQPEAGAAADPAFPLTITAISGVTDEDGRAPDLSVGDLTVQVVPSA